MIEGLGRPQNALALAQIRAAVRIGIAPSVFRHEWSKSDQLAVLAFMEHEDRDRARGDAERARIHQPCGQPIDLAFNPATSGWWEAFGVQCQACLAEAEYKREHEKDSDHEAVVTYVVSTLPKGEQPAPYEWPHVEHLRQSTID